MMNIVMDWLTEDENPAIKYRTMIELCDRKPNEYLDCYTKIWEQKQIFILFSKQDENGLWNMKGIRDSSLVQSLTVFAEYGLCKDKRLDRYVDYTINLLQSWKKDDIDVFACCAPITLRALVMLGYHERSDVMELISEFASSQIHDGGFMCKRNLIKKPARKSCYKAAIAGLLLYAECKRKNILHANTDNLVDYFLKRDVFFSSDRTISFINERGVPKGFGPMKFGIPLVVSALSILGAGCNPDLQKAWMMMKEKEDQNGRFRLEGSAKQPSIFGKHGHENKWATFYAMLAEKYRTL